MSVEYNQDIEKQIMSYLDGWKIETTSSNASSESQKEVSPFIDDINKYADNPNKKISWGEVQTFYNQALDKAYLYCNRLNVDDLTNIEEQMFIKGVCLLTASDLWNKYNIRVNNEDMEDTYVQSYGGLLYKQSINILKSFINQRVYTLTGMKKEKQTNDDVWFI